MISPNDRVEIVKDENRITIFQKMASPETPCEIIVLMQSVIIQA